MKSLLVLGFILFTAGLTASADVCRTTCANDIQLVMESVEATPGVFRCISKVNVPCAPYACANAYGCKTKCASSKDCTAGYGCSSMAQCTPKVYDCADNITVRSFDGGLTSCAPYQCLSGQCRSTCSGNIDCSGNYKCVNQACVPK